MSLYYGIKWVSIPIIKHTIWTMWPIIFLSARTYLCFDSNLGSLLVFWKEVQLYYKKDKNTQNIVIQIYSYWTEIMLRSNCIYIKSQLVTGFKILLQKHEYLFRNKCYIVTFDTKYNIKSSSFEIQ